eukprot:SAG11_NODE_1980_length_3970_cov_4.679669_3_plen_212_part_00
MPYLAFLCCSLVATRCRLTRTKSPHALPPPHIFPHENLFRGERYLFSNTSETTFSWLIVGQAPPCTCAEYVARILTDLTICCSRCSVELRSRFCSTSFTCSWDESFSTNRNDSPSSCLLSIIQLVVDSGLRLDQVVSWEWMQFAPAQRTATIATSLTRKRRGKWVIWKVRRWQILGPRHRDFSWCSLVCSLCGELVWAMSWITITWIIIKW